VTTARQHVLAYFKKQRFASASEAARALKMSAANVRHHLSVLLSDGRIVISDISRKEGRGRPVKLYRLSEHLSGNNLALLADVLLDEQFTKRPAAKREDVLRALAKGLIREIGQTSPEAPVAKQLAFALEKLNKLHYQARWEAGAEGPRILFGHCPYAAIIQKHPELCQMDAALLGELMGSTAHQIAKIGLGADGPANCIFRFS
jgi:predicted ArsR family transcriptional regulator